ncbi:MAG: hypothetical protein AB7I42_29300 [Bradyrhizobium sp.]|uniref:hypothetical protein n=1 Tax=Bradyrhizobium sp. TaxID=376 RepID=UPI003D0D8BFC
MNAAFRRLAPALMTIALTTGAMALADEVAQPAERPRQYRPLSIAFPDSPGKRFFASRVLPKLAANGCFSCHTPAPGDVHPAMQYEHLLPYLAMGQSATNNILMLKLANQRSFSPQQPEHVGGQRCATEDAEPCKSIQAWWQVEFRKSR